MKNGIAVYSFVAVNKRLKIDVVDANVVSSMFEDSDHYTVLMRMKMNEN